MVKKSIAAMSFAWLFRNDRHVWDGGFLLRILYFLIVDSAISMPSKASSSLIRGTPQVELSRDMRWMSSLISSGIFGRPVRFALESHRQYSLKPSLCHLTTVSGLTITRQERQLGQIVDNQAHKIRSDCLKRGRLAER